MFKGKAAELESKDLFVERPRVGPLLGLLALAVAAEFILPRSEKPKKRGGKKRNDGRLRRYSRPRGGDSFGYPQRGWKDILLRV